MLGHVPFRDVLFATLVANERPHSRVLPEMNFKVGSSIILLIAALILAVEFIDI